MEIERLRSGESAAEAAARQAQDLADEAVAHAGELQRLVEQMQKEAAAHAVQRDEVQKYEAAAAEELRVYEQHTPAGLASALREASAELQQASLQIQLGQSEMETMRF